eukprot:INCI9923.4.p1 GENE.INCI9923.4~~INCI9923.4.p1  ORF type:complete len:1656 (+),score=236.80 INCI9923.4:346-5313(+)
MCNAVLRARTAPFLQWCQVVSVALICIGLLLFLVAFLSIYNLPLYAATADHAYDCSDVPLRMAATCGYDCYDSAPTTVCQNNIEYPEFDAAAFLFPASVTKEDIFPPQTYPTDYYYYYYSYYYGRRISYYGFYYSAAYSSSLSQLTSDFFLSGTSTPRLYRSGACGTDNPRSIFLPTSLLSTFQLFWSGVRGLDPRVCPYCKDSRLGFGSQCTGCVQQFCNSDIPWLNNNTAIAALGEQLESAGVTDPNTLALARDHPVCSIIPGTGYMPCGQGLGCDYHCSPGMHCTDDQACGKGATCQALYSWGNFDDALNGSVVFDADHSGVIGWAGQMTGYQYYGKVVDEDHLQIFRRRQLLEHNNVSDKQHKTKLEFQQRLDRAQVDSSDFAADDVGGAPRRQLAVCGNTCSYAFDGDCDDGGPNSDFSVCNYGSDCGDCGVRDQDDGGYDTAYYPTVEACPAEEPGCICTNECEHSRNFNCEDGGEGSSEFICDLGSDCRDCGPRYPKCGEFCDTIDKSPGDFAVFSGLGCSTNGNGICEDGGPGATAATCEFGQDADDCGPRALDGFGFCGHRCRDSTLFKVLCIGIVLSLITMALLATGKRWIRQYDDGRKKTFTICLVNFSLLFYTVCVWSFMGACASDDIGMNEGSIGTMSSSIVAFGVAMGFLGLGIPCALFSCAPRNFVLTYTYIIGGIFLGAFTLVGLFAGIERREFQGDFTSPIEMNQRKAFNIAQLYLGKSQMESDYWLFSLAVTTALLMASLILNVTFAFANNGRCNCRNGCIYMEYVPARLLVFWAVHIVFLYDDRSQLGNWVLCLLVMLCFTILQPAFFALLGFCTAVKEQSNRFVEHPHPGPEPTLIALSIGDVVEQVANQQGNGSVLLRTIQEAPKVVLTAAIGRDRIWGTQQCDEVRDLKNVMPGAFGDDGTPWPGGMAFYRPRCAPGYLPLGDVFALDTLLPDAAVDSSAVDVSDASLELKEDLDHFRAAARMVGAEAVAKSTGNVADVARAAKLKKVVRSQMETSAIELQNMQSATQAYQQQRSSAARLAERMAGEQYIGTALALPFCVVPAKRFTLVWRNHPSWNRHDLQDLSIWIPEDEIGENGERYRPLGCVAVIGVGDPEPGCIGLVAESLLRLRPDSQWATPGATFRDPATTLRMVWNARATLFNTEALGSVLWARNVLMEADDIESRWRRGLRALDEDCETPSEMYNKLDELVKLPALVQPTKSASELKGGSRDVLNQLRVEVLAVGRRCRQRCGRLWSSAFKAKFREILLKFDQEQLDDGSSEKPFLLHLKDVQTGESMPVQVCSDWSFERVQHLLRDVRKEPPSTLGQKKAISFIYAGVRMEPSARLLQSNVLAGSTLYYLLTPKSDVVHLPQPHVDHDAGTDAANELEARATAAAAQLRCRNNDTHMLRGVQVKGSRAARRCSECLHPQKQSSLCYQCADNCAFRLCPTCVLRLEQQQAGSEAPCTTIWAVTVDGRDAHHRHTLALPLAVAAASSESHPRAYDIKDGSLASPDLFQDTLSHALLERSRAEWAQQLEQHTRSISLSDEGPGCWSRGNPVKRVIYFRVFWLWAVLYLVYCLPLPALVGSYDVRVATLFGEQTPCQLDEDFNVVWGACECSDGISGYRRATVDLTDIGTELYVADTNYPAPALFRT